MGAPFVVKAHGSELEFSIRGNEELADWAQESLDEASAVLAGSEHIRGVLEAVVGPGEYSNRVHIVPPGVDVEQLQPEPRDEALVALVAQSELDPPNPGRVNERFADPGNAERLAAFLAGGAPTVVFVGKLSEEKGVSLLLDALDRIPEARAVIVGFGPERDALEARATDRILFTGPLEHRHLAHLWPLADVSVTPSVFAEAFGMVAAEAAACGSPPLVARHSGLAEIAAAIETEYPPQFRHLAAFENGDVSDLEVKLRELLALSAEDRTLLGAAARKAAVEHFSWERIAALILSL